MQADHCQFRQAQRNRSAWLQPRERKPTHDRPFGQVGAHQDRLAMPSQGILASSGDIGRDQPRLALDQGAGQGLWARPKAEIDFLQGDDIWREIANDRKIAFRRMWTGQAAAFMQIVACQPQHEPIPELFFRKLSRYPAIAKTGPLQIHVPQKVC